MSKRVPPRKVSFKSTSSSPSSTTTYRYSRDFHAIESERARWPHCRSCLPPQTQQVAGQIVELLLGKRKLRHDGTRRDRLRITEVPEMPFPIRPRIPDIREIRAHRSAGSVDAMARSTAELIEERFTTGHRWIHAWNRV